MCTRQIVNAQYTLIIAGRFQMSSRPIQLSGLEAWLCGTVLPCPGDSCQVNVVGSAGLCFRVVFCTQLALMYKQASLPCLELPDNSVFCSTSVVPLLYRILFQVRKLRQRNFRTFPKIWRWMCDGPGHWAKSSHSEICWVLYHHTSGSQFFWRGAQHGKGCHLGGRGRAEQRVAICNWISIGPFFSHPLLLSCDPGTCRLVWVAGYDNLSPAEIIPGNTTHSVLCWAEHFFFDSVTRLIQQDGF